MRDWKDLHYTNTFREMVDLWNKNKESSAFIDSMVGTVLCNGVLFQGKETVDGMLIRPLEKVDLSGTVQSNTILDNFTLYYRDSNNLVTLNRFPVDLLSYANGKLQFLFIKEDLTYRVSDYMFGGVDEILLARFVINTDSTWNQFYIMAQRAGTPMYNAGDEFYEVEGIFVKSPRGLELSHTSGTVKRSGIEFTDKISPDIYQNYNLTTDRVPLRYVNTLNEVDYTQPVTYNVITDKYMIYNQNKRLKIEAEDYIRIIQNMYFGVEDYSNSVANELHSAILAGGETLDLKQIIDAYISYIDKIYIEVDNLYNLLGDEVLNSVRRAAILENKNLINAYITEHVNVDTINEETVKAIRIVPCYIENINLAVCALPLENVLQEIQDGLNGITFDAGTINTVPAGKFTVQRILWDIYEGTLIMQYGDKVFDTLDAAVDGTELLEYPAPFGKTIYIPLSIMILKSGITSINDDTETVIVDRRWEIVDQEMTEYADYISRAKADKALNQIYSILNGTVTVPKSDSLKCTVDGTTTYKDGDYFLNYDNLRNKMAVINNLTTTQFNAKEALAASQGKVLNDKFASYLPITGGTLSGNLNTTNLLPKAHNTYNLGSGSYYWANAYINTLSVNKISASSNISTNGNLYATNGSLNSKTASISGALSAGSLSTTGALSAGSASISGNATIGGTLTAANLTVNGSLSTKNLSVSGTLSTSGGARYIISGNNSIVDARAMAKSTADNNWSGFSNGTVVFCW